jgi:hypothetical protein
MPHHCYRCGICWQNLRDYPRVTLVFREQGAAPDVRQTYGQILLRYRAEGSTTRNDLQIRPVALAGLEIRDAKAVVLLSQDIPETAGHVHKAFGIEVRRAVDH